MHCALCIEAEAAPSPYGVNAHLWWLHDPAERKEECRWIAATGIGRVRIGLQWAYVQKQPDAPFDFSHYDRIVGEAAAQGLTILPIVDYPPQWARPVWDHLEEYGKFVEAVVTRYGDRFSDIEVWNEVNIWRECTPEHYLEILKTAYEAVRYAEKTAPLREGGGAEGDGGSPAVRVLFSGTAGVALDFLGKIYELGGARYFDAVNVHPYCHPRAPEGYIPGELKSLRALMANHGDAGKPIVITELGWPTHDARVPDLHVLLAGLKVARPEKKSWRAVYAPSSSIVGGVAEALAEGLPQGSTAETCLGARLRERLAVGDVDLVVYPFDESFPADTFEDVRAFVVNGGVLAILGGMPMWYPSRETAPGIFQIEDGKALQAGRAARESLRIDGSMWPESVKPLEKGAFPTPAAIAAGYKGDPAGEKAFRYQTPRLLRDGDEFIPLLTRRDANGAEGVVASVTRLNGGTNGCVIVSGTMPNRGSVGEDGQARYLVCSMAIAFAEGVEQYFWYEFRSPEKDPFYSEHHFGLTHSNFTPKPAWGAYRNFVLARPAGSVQSPGEWHDAKGEFFFPQWTRPDGTSAGVLWTTGPAEKRVLRFVSGGAGGPPAADARERVPPAITFRDYTGRVLKPARCARASAPLHEGGGPEGAEGSPAASAYLVPISGAPIYFEGGALLPNSEL